MNRRAAALALLLAAALLSACGGQRGVAEFAAFRDAVAQTRTTSDAVLDRIAAAERRLWRWCANYPELAARADFDPQACTRFVPGQTRFALSHVPYLAEADDPPAAAAFRRTIAAVDAYAAALDGVASGAAAESIAARMDGLAGIAAQAAALPAAGPLAPVAGLAAQISGINDNLAALSPLASALVAIPLRERFREELLDRAPLLRAALDGVIRATPTLFDTLLAAELVAAPPGEDPEVEEIERQRVLLANWVVMLQAAQTALDRATAAAGRDGDAAGLLQSGRRLAEAAREARRALAGED